MLFVLLFDLNLALSVGPVVTGAVGDLLHQGGGGGRGGMVTQFDPLVSSWLLGFPGTCTGPQTSLQNCERLVTRTHTLSHLRSRSLS